MVSSNSEISEQSQEIPIFYKNPVVITSEQHASAKYRREKPAVFARDTGLIPLIISDISEAAKYYPIVFTQEEVPMPVALVGLERHNYFIGPEGDWMVRCYAPSYIRKHPFLFMKLPEEKLILCIEESCLIEEHNGGGFSLYDGEHISTHTMNELEFCKRHHENHMETVNFCSEINDRGLLSPHESKVELKNKRCINTGGFQLIDQDRLKGLSERDILKWQNNGYLALIHYIQQCITNWQTLIDLAFQNDLKMATAD